MYNLLLYNHINYKDKYINTSIVVISNTLFNSMSIN